jgi:acyl carrier protein
VEWAGGGRLRTLLTGGDRLRKVGWGSRAFEVVNHYGPTEGTVVTTAGVVREGEGEIGIGRPIGNTRVYVVDGHGQAVGVGVVGELYVGGESVGRGYGGRADLTAERFVPDRWSGERGGRVYRTGDLVRYREDGELEFVGRGDGQIKLRGYRIELGEIEHIVVQHETIQEAIVLLREDTRGARYLVAYLRLSVQAEFVEAELRNYLQARLPDYMLPTFFLTQDSFPLTSNGKIDRRALPAPDFASGGLKQTYMAPRSSTERELATLWTQILGVEQIGIHDNFFLLGGHSLLATQVVSHLRVNLHVEISLRKFFELSTIALLAEYIETAKLTAEADQSLPLKRVSRDAYRKKMPKLSRETTNSVDQQ